MPQDQAHINADTFLSVHPPGKEEIWLVITYMHGRQQTLPGDSIPTPVTFGRRYFRPSAWQAAAATSLPKSLV